MHVNLLKASIFTPFRGGRWGLPLLCWGMPGAAKTAVIEEICAKYGMPCETLSPSERGEGAFGVVPVPAAASTDHSYLFALGEKIIAYTKAKVPYEDALAKAVREIPNADMFLSYPRPEWTNKFATEGRGVVFVDEVTSTPPALQAPLMGLILARRIGGYILPKGVRILAAANPVEIAAGGFDLAAPLANRMGHIEWSAPTSEEHIQFMMRGSSSYGKTEQLLAEMDADLDGEPEAGEPETFDVDSEEKRVLKAWPEAWAIAVGSETSFIRARSSLKNVMPKEGDAKTGRAWPSDRTWDYATHAYAGALVHDLSQAERETYVEAFIGAGAAQEWFAFMDKLDLPDPAKILDGVEKFKHDPIRLDRSVAVLQSCVALVSPKTAKKRADRGDALWGLLEKMAAEKADLDIIIPSVHSLIDAELHSLKTAAKTLAFVNPVLKKAGVSPRRR